MKAIAFRKTGPTDVLEEKKLPRPETTSEKVRGRVVAAGVDHQILCFEATGQRRVTEQGLDEMPA